MLKSTVVLLALCFSFPALVSADQFDNQGESAYHQLLSAQQHLLQSELTQHKTRLHNLQQLEAGGHASWLEVQRQQLTTQTAEAQLHYLNQLSASVQQAHESRPDESIFEGMHGLPGKLLFTDLQLKAQSSGRSIESTRLEEFTTKSQQNITDAYQMPASVQMEFVTAHQALATGFQNWMQEQNDTSNSNAGNGASQVSGKLLAASRKQCAVHNQLIDQLLSQERQRLEKVNELFALNMTSGKDIEILNGRINQLVMRQQALKQVTSYLMQQEASSGVELESSAERSLNQEICFQFELHEARFQKASANLEMGFHQAVLSRLEVAAAQTSNQNNSRLGNSLAIGQQNEINNYRHKIRMMELEAEFAQCRMDVLNAQGESGTFLAVNLDNDPEQSLSFAGLASASLVGMLTAPASKRTALSSALFDSSFDPFPFEFKSHHGRFQSATLTSRTPVYFARSTRPKISSTPSSLRSSLYRSSLGSSRSRSRSYSYGGPTRKTHPTYGRAYPFGQVYQYGAVRSNLRPHLRAGQIPWQLPGTTPNFGSTQLRSNRQFNSFGSSSLYGW